MCRAFLVEGARTPRRMIGTLQWGSNGSSGFKQTTMDIGTPLNVPSR